MFEKIMVPVDLQHVDKLERSLEIAATLAKKWHATLHFVTVAGRVPNRAAKTPEEHARNLAKFAEEQGEKHGVPTASLTKDSTDVTVELEKKLLEAADDIGADLIVTASHVPGVADKLHLIPSHSGELASKAKCSVFVLRGDVM
ncbi:universal stress protein [Wenzhouxiangella sp. AB-CW3]|uniref:universal stress protein n=1 Tax=Wenzhouxiangella sp. AB-CW3 TaxID=2771012 RepID=UPI00168B69B3|nr:universal stress protein [Wenzhouxiangella sp. AB-CW3]QOC21751.1 universal stress protein [Wenzhouxiangella sp. AB-CW3]